MGIILGSTFGGIFIFCCICSILTISSLIIIILVIRKLSFYNRKIKYLKKFNKYHEMKDINNDDLFVNLIDEFEKFNNIDYSSIKFLKNDNGENIILGQGASSIVFLGVYKDEKVALKLMKETNYDSNLMSEIMINM
jgi:hypothetical protein